MFEEYYVVLCVLGSVCFMAGTGLSAFLAYKLVEVSKSSNAALACMFELASTHLASKSLLEKAQHDTVKADTDARIKILQDSLEVERQQLEQMASGDGDFVVLSDGKVINEKEWTRV